MAISQPNPHRPDQVASDLVKAGHPTKALLALALVQLRWVGPSIVAALAILQAR